MAAVAGGLSAIFPTAHAAASPDLLCPRSTTTEAIAEPGRLVTKFDLTVFRSEFENHQKVLDVVRRWPGQVHVDLSRMPDRYKAYVGRVVRDLSCLTGLRTYIHEEGSRPVPNFYVSMFTRDVLDALARQDNVDVESLKHVHCIVTPGLDIDLPGRNSTFIYFLDAFSEAEKRNCLVKMMARAFGLFADSDVVQPSIFSPDGAELDYLPINDKIILRTLYDPRIERGMKREDAMEIARQIIPELVKAVRERGVEALYQR
ncbi:MAG: DUF2927 domain-containing protein [Rhodospirillales bacterium]